MVEIDIGILDSAPPPSAPPPVGAGRGSATSEEQPGVVAGLSDADTAARLVAAASEVFAEKGYDKAGVAEIARRAGLTTGAIYSRFSGKAELLAETLRTCAGAEFDALFAEHGFEGGATDILETVGTHLVTRATDPLRALLLEAFVAARRDPDVAEVLRAHLGERAARLAEIIDRSKDAGLVDPSLDTGAVIHFAHAVGLGFLLYEAVGASHPAPDEWEGVVHRVVAAVRPPAPVDPAPSTQH